jgi:hypothetical protein
MTRHMLTNTEVRNRIYTLCASDTERLVEKHISKRNTESTSDAFFAARGYCGLTQASRQTRGVSFSNK